MISQCIDSLTKFFTSSEVEQAPSAQLPEAVAEEFAREAFQRKIYPAEVNLPEKLSPEGIYGICLTQAEMYDLGNIGWIDRYFIFDRKTGGAVDVTSMLDEAPLLSARENAAEVSEQGRLSLAGWLNGGERPEYCEEFPQGVRRFNAREIDSSQAPIFRAYLQKVMELREGLNAAVHSLEQKILEIKGDVFR